MAQLSKTTIRLSDVQKALGYFPNTVSGVCTYSGINKWSLHKPFQSNTVEFPTYEYLTNALRAASCGLTWEGGSTEDSFTALLPQGGSTSQPDQASPYRLGDFRGYDHWQEHMIGVNDIKPSINLGNFSSFTHVSPLSGGENGIGLLDLRGLFMAKGMRYLYFQMRLPKSGGTYVPDVNVILGCIDLQSEQSIQMSNRMVCKFGRTEDGAGTIYAFLSDDPDITTILSPTPGFDFQKTGTYDPVFTVGDINPANQQWNSVGAASSLRIGTGPSQEETNTFEYYSYVEYGSPRYLDLSNGAQQLYVYTGTIVATENTPLRRGNVYLRITDWLRRKEWYVTVNTPTSSSSSGWEITGGTGLWLGASLEYFAKFTTGFCGFSLVYRAEQTGYECIPLTKELFCRVIWPDSLQEPMNIFDEDGPVIG